MSKRKRSISWYDFFARIRNVFRARETFFAVPFLAPARARLVKRYSFIQIGYQELNVIKLAGNVLHDSHRLVMHPKMKNGCLRHLAASLCTRAQVLGHTLAHSQSARRH